MARVLIVDDDEEARRFEASILETAGHQLFFAKTGEEAMKAFLRKDIQIIVTELQTPRGNGFELIEAVTGLNPDVTVIAVSSTGREMLDTAKVMGARATFEKPVSPTGLLAAVADGVDRMH